MEERSSLGEESDLSLMREIFYHNLLEDIHAEYGPGELEITPELQNRIDKRILGFLRVSDGGDRLEEGGTRTKRNAAQELIEAETAGAEHFFLKGFRERGYVPVNFPNDICLLKVGQTVFAASLHMRKSKDNYANHTVVSFYVRQKGHFQKYKEYSAIVARKFDCISHASLGFVAVVNYYDNAQEQDSPKTHRTFDDGSPVFQIQENSTTEIVQKFNQSNQNTVHMWTHGNHIYLTHTYTNLDESVANVCPLYRWSGYHFDVIDELPCYNSIHIEPFTIEQTLFIAIANQMNDEAVDEDTFSDVFKFDYERQKFDFHQKIYVYSVSDIKYFYLDHGDIREHFLVTGNSRAGKKNRSGKLDYDQHSIVYKYIDGYFVPFQKFELHGVKQFLPVMRENGEFLLLIRCRGRPLQIYEYDGWKFAPSRIDYTREAFAAGVSQMRVYRHVINGSLIVIANRNLFGTTANIFSPLYGVGNDLKEVYGEFINWCGDTTEQLAELNLEEVYKKLVALPKVDDEAVRFGKEIQLKHSTVEVLRTKVLQTDKFVFNQQTFDYLNKIRKDLQVLKNKAEHLKAIIDSSLRLDESLDIKGDLRVPEVIAARGLVRELDAQKVNNEKQPVARAHEPDQGDVVKVDRLIVDERLAVKFLNGYASETLLRTSDDLSALKDVELHVKEIDVHGEFYVEKLIDGIHFSPDNVLIEGVDQTFTNKTLLVDQLIANNMVTPLLNSSKVEKIMSYANEAGRLMEARSQIRATEYYPMRLKEIRVDNLTMSGLINEVDLGYIDRNALKNTGDQVITASYNFDNIIAANLTIPNKRLSGIDLNLLVLTEPTEDQPYITVRQDVQFISPVLMDKLQITDRINHVSVVDDRLQVLLLNSTEPQMITGTKIFDNIEVLGPIHLQGKINSSSLSKLNPIATITEDIYLEGDFEITGDVTIRRLLNTSNVYGASRTYNYKDLYHHGLPLNAVSSQQNFTFKQPIIVQHAFGNNFNDYNPSDFIPSNSGKLQRITGRKIFTGDLTIRGNRVDAAVINQVNLKQLNSTILKRTGNQIIEGTIHFKELIASSSIAKQTLFEDRPLASLLTSGHGQPIKSALRFENCQLTVREDLIIENLETYNSSTIYGYDLEHMIQDTLRKNPAINSTVTVTGPKSFYNLTVGELVLVDQATLNGVDLIGLKKIGDPLEKDLLVKETLILKNPIRVRNVFFNGSINGVSKHDFGRNWLMNEYNQTFTAPQTFENVVAEQVFLDGLINGVKLEDLVEDLYFLDKNERVQRVEFNEGLVSYQPVIVNGVVSGLNLATDVVLDRSKDQQQLKELYVDGNLLVRGQLYVSSKINDMNYAKLKEYVTSNGSEHPIKVEAQGNVHFHQQPDVAQLNGYRLEELHREIWLSNRDEVLTGNFRFQTVNFENNVLTKGPINDLDLDELQNTYLSVSKPQNVSTPMIFSGPAMLKTASFEEATLKGKLKGSIESIGIDIAEFDKHVLKKDVPQTITGNWIIHRVAVHGNLNISTLNGLDIHRDILLNNVPHATFTGSKRFDNFRVRNLICPAPCIIQGVDFNEWVANSVRLGQNHTIDGILYLESASVLGNVECSGLVNNITFNRDTLLLKSVPQIIEGDLYVNMKIPEQNLVYPASIESLQVDTINGKNFSEFVQNLALRDRGTLKIHTPVSFRQPLETQNLDLGNNSMYGVNINQLLQEVEYGDQLMQYESKLRNLNVVGQSLVETFNTVTPFLSHFNLVQTSLKGRFRSVSAISLPLSPAPVDLLVAHVNQENYTAVEFYRWHKKDQQFRIAKGFLPITSPKLIVNNAKRINIGHVQHLFVEFNEPTTQSYRQSFLDLEPPDFMMPKKIQPKFMTIYEFNSTIPRNVVNIKLFDLDCIGLYSAKADGIEVHCLQLENLVYYMRFHQMLVTPAVRQANFIDQRLIVLSRDGLLQVWRSQPNRKLSLTQLIKSIHASAIAVAKFEYQLFIAVNSESPESEDSTTAHHGSIEIWRDSRPSQANGTFSKYQTILSKVPRQIQLSVLPTASELMLYALKDDPFHPLVIYRYEGVAGFREHLTSKTLRTTSKRLAVVKLERNQRELLALVADREIRFVEAVVKGT
ncbi:uncharacterized protein LOC129741603 isoform X2 [Uranotaenia lowii]|nr:uncharacterized protein LOC129741603 isoform X2 [Uranotaenia lowii]